MAFVDSYMQRGLPTAVACVHVCPILCQKVDNLWFISKASMMHCSVSILVLQMGGREWGVERAGNGEEGREQGVERERAGSGEGERGAEGEGERSRGGKGEEQRWRVKRKAGREEKEKNGRGYKSIQEYTGVY